MATPAPARVRFSLRWKITLPFMLLALLLGLGAASLLNLLLSQTEDERFLRQLANGGQQAADAVVRIEVDLLAIQRAVANTEGVVDAVLAADAEGLRARVLPLAVNTRVDVVAVLDATGTGLLALRRAPDAPPGEYSALRGETYYTEWPFVGRVLRGETDAGVGDKHTGLHSVRIAEREVFALMIGGPLRDASGRVLGAVLVGRYLDGLTAAVAGDAGANISVYELVSGRLLSSSLEPEEPGTLALTPELIDGGLGLQGDLSPVRTVAVAGVEYGEVITPLLARGGTPLALMGVSLLYAPVGMSMQDNLAIVVRLSALSMALIVLVGLWIASRITRPLVDMAEASAQVATGNLEARVPDRGNDEIAVLARSFNSMVEGLRQGLADRDLLSRAVAPELQHQLRRQIETETVEPGGQRLMASVLCADLAGIADQADQSGAAQALTTLNECFSAAAAAIRRHGGVVSAFDGQSLMAVFGVLPRPLPAPVSALQATHTGMEILEHIQALNRERFHKDLPELSLGVGVSTGPVIAGGIGTTERLQYTVIGDTVSTAQRIQQVTREIGHTVLLIGEETHRSLAGAQGQFEFGRTGVAQLRDKGRQVTVHEVRGRRIRLVEPPGPGREP